MGRAGERAGEASNTASAPIWIRCEGSGCPPTTGVGNGSLALGMCSMCGEWLHLKNYVMIEHVRDDILARVARGDFDQHRSASAWLAGD